MESTTNTQSADLPNKPGVEFVFPSPAFGTEIFAVDASGKRVPMPAKVIVCPVTRTAKASVEVAAVRTLADVSQPQHSVSSQALMLSCGTGAIRSVTYQDSPPPAFARKSDDSDLMGGNTGS